MKKHFYFAAALICLVATLARGQQEWATPFNPDHDVDGIVGVQDLLAFLQVFGTYWEPYYDDVNPTNEIQFLALESDSLRIKLNPAVALPALFNVSADGMSEADIDSLLQPFQSAIARSEFVGPQGVQGPPGPPGPAGQGIDSIYVSGDSLLVWLLDSQDSISMSLSAISIPSVASQFNPLMPDPFVGVEKVSMFISHEAQSAGPYTVPEGKNLYVRRFACNPNRYCTGGYTAGDAYRLNGYGIWYPEGCYQTNSTPRVFGPGMTLSFGGGYSCTTCAGDTYAKIEGFLVDALVEVLFPMVAFVVPEGKIFIKYIESELPEFFVAGETVPAHTMGYLMLHP